MKGLRKVWAEAAAPINAERALLRAIRTGSGALVARLWHRIYNADGMNSLWYALATVWALAGLGWSIGQVWWAAPALGLVWLLAALRLGGTPPPDKIDNDAGESDESTPEDSPAPPTRHEFVLQLAELIGTRNGVLLTTVVKHFREAGAPPKWGIPEARAQCAALGIPVRSIKVAGSTSIGVHRDGLWAALHAGLQPPADPSPETTPGPLAKSGQSGE